MNVTIAAIGKLKRGPELELTQRYQKRLRWPIAVLEQSEAPSHLLVNERKEKEGEFHLHNLKTNASLITLDEGGKNLDSQAFAHLLRGLAEKSGPDLRFAIGGPDGLGQSVLERSDFVLSFGKLTWPHQIVRALLLEQLYRAQTILDGHPYHRQ
jgi:23S rRNA (pseudouridine1915-N3)-methyltransferase